MDFCRRVAPPVVKDGYPHHSWAHIPTGDGAAHSDAGHRVVDIHNRQQEGEYRDDSLRVHKAVHPEAKHKPMIPSWVYIPPYLQDLA